MRQQLKLLVTLLLGSTFLLACSGPADRLWLKAPGWSRALLIGNTRVADPVPMALDDVGNLYALLIIGGSDDTMHARIVAIDRQAEIVWDQTYDAIELRRPDQPRIFWADDGLRLFWIDGDRLYTALVSRAGDLLDESTLLSGDVQVGDYDVAHDGEGKWMVWFAGPRRNPGVYAIPTGNLSGGQQATLVDPDGVYPDLQYAAGALHALWAYYPTGFERKRFFYASYADGDYQPDQEMIVLEPSISVTSVLEGPHLGLDETQAYIFWTVVVRTGLEAGSAQTSYMHFPNSQPAQASEPRQLFVPAAYDLPYEPDGDGVLNAGLRVPWSATRGAPFITSIIPDDVTARELVVGFHARVPYLRRKDQGQVGTLFFRDGQVTAYQLLSFTPADSDNPAVLGDQDGYLVYGWLERSAPGFLVYVTRTDPEFRTAVGGITMGDAGRLSAEIAFGLASSALLLPFALIWIVVPLLVLGLTSFFREEDATLGRPAVLISLALALFGYWGSKFAILPGMRDYVPFSAWLPFIPSWLEAPLRIGVPALIAAIALFTAWYYTYRVERRSALFLFLIYALIDGILTMAVYGVLVFGAF